MRGGSRFDVGSSGIGDTRLSGLFKIFDNKFSKLIFQLVEVYQLGV